MAPKKLPSSCGLPSSWNSDMELRLGFLEAQDEIRDLKDLIRTLKREFPDLADVSIMRLYLCYWGELTLRFWVKYVITVESLLQWIEWLDWQDGPRGDSYRAGITAGQALAQQMHFAPDFEFGPVDFDEYMEPSPPTNNGSQANLGVRLVDNDNDSKEGIRSAAGGLESTTTGKTSPRSSHATPNSVYYTASRTRDIALPAIATTPTSGAPRRLHSRGAGTWGPCQDTATIEDNHRTRQLGIPSSTSLSGSPVTQPRSASTTSASPHVPDIDSQYLYPATPTTPAAVAFQQRTVSNDSEHVPRRSSSANNHNAATLTSLASSNSTMGTPTKPKATSIAESSPSPGSGLRERRQLRGLNVDVAGPSHLRGALPQIRGKENEQSSVKSVASSGNRTSLRDRMKARIARK